jgi:putative phage-type endonuclease
MQDLIQGSPEWTQARVGSLGASRIADITARTKSGYGASRANVMAELVCERLTNLPAERFVTPAMQHGIDCEAEARSTYEFELGVTAKTCGLFRHPTIEGTHASPDGLIGDDGCLEVKCPNTATHIETLLSKRVPERYIKQIQWQLACTGRRWCDYCTYDNRMPSELQLWIFRVMRDQKMIDELEREARIFLDELDEKVAALMSLGRIEKAA